MKWNDIAKRLVVCSLSGLLCVTGLTGCGDNTKIVITTGLSGNQLFKIGSSTCTMPEVMVYLTTFFNEYVDTYGEEMWHYDFGGVSLEEHVKDVVLSKMAQIKIMNLMAKEYEIALTNEEEERIETAANCYYEKLSDTLKKQEDITFEVVKNVYREYTLANKVYSSITETADMEISDDEARAVTVQTIYFKNWKLKSGERVPLEEQELAAVWAKGQEALQQIGSGEKFENVSAAYSEEKQLVQSYARGDVEPEFEEILFSLDEGECSGLIETEDGIYIVKCVSTIDYEATQANKLVLAEKRKKEAFSKAYNEIAAGTHSQFRDKLWESMTLDAAQHKTDANFFEIYEEYIKQ